MRPVARMQTRVGVAAAAVAAAPLAAGRTSRRHCSCAALAHALVHEAPARAAMTGNRPPSMANANTTLDSRTHMQRRLHHQHQQHCLLDRGDTVGATGRHGARVAVAAAAAVAVAVACLVGSEGVSVVWAAPSGRWPTPPYRNLDLCTSIIALLQEAAMVGRRYTQARAWHWGCQICNRSRGRKTRAAD